MGKNDGSVVGTWRAVRSGDPGRELRRLTNAENAHLAIGGLERGGAILGLTKGQFSLIDLIRACLEVTGPADVVVSTWTAARKEIDDSAELLNEGRIRSLRWLVDFSFPRRQPEYCAQLVERFGESTIRVTKNHAKFLTIVGGGWSLVCRTSMNLNKNSRFEYFELEDSPALVEFLLWVVDEVFEVQGVGDGLRRRPGENVREFKGLGVEAAGVQGSAFGVSLDNPLKPGLEVLR